MNREDETYWQQLEPYSEGQLSEEGKKTLEEWLKVTPEAQATLAGLEKLKQTLPDEEQRAAYHSKRMETIVRTAAQSKQGRYAVLLAAASVSVLVLMVSIVYNAYKRPSPDQLVEKYSSEFYSAPFLTRDDGAQVADWVSYYQQKEFEKAFMALKQTAKQDEATIFYSGMALFYLEEYEEALNYLSSKQLDRSLFHQQRLWYSALAHLNLGQTDQAVQDLRRIERNRWYRKEEAKELLKVLN